jgi:acyl carrier protein
MQSATLDDIKHQLRVYIAQSIGLAEPPGDNERLVERGFIASVRLLDLVGFLEDTFKVRMRPVDLTPDKLATITQISESVHRRATAP